MAKNQIQIRIGMRQNKNTKSAGYGKYYPEVIHPETLTTRGLLEHIMSHGLGYPRAIVQGVLTQLAECLTELMLQGQPVKLDGFGTFKLNCISDSEGVPTTLAQMHQNLDPRSMIKGLKLVVIPENAELDKLTSTANLEKAALTIDSVVESKIRTNSKGQEARYTSITDLETWRQAHPLPNS